MTGTAADWSLAARQRTFDHVKSSLFLCSVPFFFTHDKITSVHVALVSYSALYLGV